MRRNVTGFKGFVFVLPLIILLSACQPSTSTSSTSEANMRALADDPISATKKLSVPPASSVASTPIKSFSAQVTRITTSKRNPTKKITRTYTISKKIVNGIICVRVDFPANGTPNSVAVSSVINGTEQRIFETSSGKVLSRVPLPKAQVPNQGITTLYQRLPISTMQAYMKAKRYSLSSSSNTLTAGHPITELSQISSVSGNAESSYQEYYDLATCVKTGSQEIFYTTDGCTHTKTQAIAYQALCGQPVPLMITTVDEIKNPKRINISDRVIPRIDDLSQLPTISSGELEQLKADPSKKVYEFKPIIGDPASLDDTVTTTEAYSCTTTNNISDAVFN